MRIATILFSPFSRAVCRIKRRLYGSGRLKPASCPVPAVSVGNIAFGGSGKTPLAMEILSLFLAAGRRPAFVSRGYRGHWEKTGGIVSDGHTLFGTWRESGDEPHMVARAFPQAGVYVGRDRRASCRLAAAAGFDVVVLDDAFQHLRLRRDLDIVLHNPEAGRSLREGPRALRQADVIVTPSGTGLRMDRMKRENPGVAIFSCTPAARALLRGGGAEELPPAALSGRRVLAVCGIAFPERFFRLLEKTGAAIAGRMVFPDHHRYPEASLRSIRKTAGGIKPDAIVTTEKDLSKLVGRIGEPDTAPLYALRIGLDIDPGFERRILAVLGPERRDAGGSP